MQDSRPRQMTTNVNMVMKPSSTHPIKMQHEMPYHMQAQNVPQRNSNIDKINR